MAADSGHTSTSWRQPWRRRGVDPPLRDLRRAAEARYGGIRTPVDEDLHHREHGDNDVDHGPGEPSLTLEDVQTPALRGPGFE